jgi:hypothetical protein
MPLQPNHAEQWKPYAVSALSDDLMLITDVDPTKPGSVVKHAMGPLLCPLTIVDASLIQTVVGVTLKGMR